MGNLDPALLLSRTLSSELLPGYAWEVPREVWDPRMASILANSCGALPMSLRHSKCPACAVIDH